MSPPAERPPSERGVEYRTLDALEELARKVDELAQRPTVLAAHPNWWDVLPVLEGIGGTPRQTLGEVLVDGMVQSLFLPVRNYAMNVELKAASYRDRLELCLRINGGWVVWQRALFFDPPMGAPAR